jgi:hypothetical protein
MLGTWLGHGATHDDAQLMYDTGPCAYGHAAEDERGMVSRTILVPNPHSHGQLGAENSKISARDRTAWGISRHSIFEFAWAMKGGGRLA